MFESGDAGGGGVGVGKTWNFPAESSSASVSEFGVGKTGISSGADTEALFLFFF